VAPPRGRAILWMIPALLALHDAEEALTFPRALPTVRERLPAALVPLAARVDTDSLLTALAVATVVPLAIVAWTRWRPDSRVALWAALAVQATMLLNVLSHVVAAAALFRGYAPGLVTAVALELPFSLVLFRRVGRERWLPRGALLALVPAALVIHGPLLVGLLRVSGGR
jgi:hypothetical protein